VEPHYRVLRTCGAPLGGLGKWSPVRGSWELEGVLVLETAAALEVLVHLVLQTLKLLHCEHVQCNLILL